VNNILQHSVCLHESKLLAVEGSSGLSERGYSRRRRTKKHRKTIANQDLQLAGHESSNLHPRSKRQTKDVFKGKNLPDEGGVEGGGSGDGLRSSCDD